MSLSSIDLFVNDTLVTHENQLIANDNTLNLSVSVRTRNVTITTEADKPSLVIPLPAGQRVNVGELKRMLAEPPHGISVKSLFDTEGYEMGDRLSIPDADVCYTTFCPDSQ